MITIPKTKPIDQDIHFKYICPNNDCTDIHWLSLKETQTKNFKVVCDCGQIFKPKTIEKIKILYKKKNNPSPKRTSEIDSAIKTLIGFGFDMEEIIAVLNNCKETNPALIVKEALQILGGKK